MIVTGCAANLNAAQFDEIAPEVTALVGTADDVADEVAGTAGPGLHRRRARAPPRCRSAAPAAS